MKKLYTFLLVAFFCFLSNAQIVNIPDPAFKSELLSLSPPIDTNGDGEIQESEALAVTYLSFGMCPLQSVEGIQAFSNVESLGFSAYCTVAEPVDISGMTSIKHLSFHKSSMPTIDVAGLTNLESISIGYGNIHFLHLNETVNLKGMSFYRSSYDGVLDLTHAPNLVSLTATNSSVSAVNLTGLVNMESISFTHSESLSSLDVSDKPNLKILRAMACNLSTLDVSNNNLIEELNVSGNELTELNISNLTQLTRLSCGANHLTSLDLSNNVLLQNVYAGENQLPSIDLSNLHKLRSVDVGNNLFTTLDFSGLTEYALGDEPLQITIWNNPNLISINLKNGRPENMGLSAQYTNCPNLIYICVDDVDLENMNYYVQQSGFNIQINTYCDFVPGGSFNTITGILTHYPEGCGTGIGYPMADIKVTLSDGTNTGIAFTDQNGRYSFYTQSGDFTVTPEMTNPIFGITPGNANVGFTDNLSNTETRDFCISAVGVVENLDLSLIPISAARPGFDAHYKLVYRNTGNQILSGDVAMTYDDSVLDLIQANPSANAQSSGNLSWNYIQLLPFESRSIDLTFNINSPMETPAVNLGDVLHFDATITPVIAGANNYATLDQVITGSFDPNDKTCLEGENIDPAKLGYYLNYVIRFQNSGTADTENIVVTDVIDTEKFDMDSFQLTASSHPHLTRISGNKVEFIFENINLPFEQENEPGSHGFVAFKIKTKNTVTTGDSVSNKADIFFDYNFPITTNTATSVFQLLARDQFEDASVSLHPNPVKNALTITANDNIKSIQLYDVMGRLIETDLQNSNTVQFDVSKQASGIYFVQITTGKGTKTEKIIKQ